MITMLIVLAVVASNNKPKTNYNTFAQCLTEKGAVMYGTYWCSHCNAQKEDFGDAFQYIDYVECSDEKEKCIENGIQGFPTWIINNEKYPGRQKMETLSELTGCELKEG
ncbi:hypothetical protein KY311_01620 [Candidatus Woesearchaeota archaeon]|nr:hypothetical protein [Candidatus Woesearchaeota archaeon]